MIENLKATIEEMLADHVGSDGSTTDGLTSLGALSTFEKIGRDLIVSDTSGAVDVEGIADTVGEVLIEILKSIDIPIVPDFVEVRLEKLAVAWVVASLKKFGRDLLAVQAAG